MITESDGLGGVIQEGQQRGNKRRDPTDNDSGLGKVRACTAAGCSARHIEVSMFKT